MTREQRAEQLVRDLSGISTLCELIKIYYYRSIKDTRFRNPKIADKAEKIKKFAESIQNKELIGYIKVREDFKDIMENEHALQLWRIFDKFLFAHTEQLEEFADGVENMENENKNNNG